MGLCKEKDQFLKGQMDLIGQLLEKDKDKDCKGRMDFEHMDK